jgi:hypothetical protein
MNILYLGPYKQKTVLGLESQAIILNLLSGKKNKLSCVPIFSDLNKILSDESINTPIRDAQNSNYDKYDCVIQHVPIGSATPIGGITKNILLPIIGAADYKFNIDTLKQFNKILVDNQKDYKNLAQHKLLKNKVSVYDYQIGSVSNDDSKIDLGIVNFHKKLYYIGDYRDNRDNILKLCTCFVTNSKRDNHVLLLFLLYLNKSQKDEIESYINKLYQLCHKNSYPKISVIGIDTDFGTLSLAHRTGDVFIDLEDAHSNALNLKISQAYNKELLSFITTDYELKYENNDMFFPNGCSIVAEGNIANKISQYLQNNTVDSIPHTKKTDINELI